MDLRGRNKVDPSFNMSSMTDFVFLLLIFFILASTLVTTNALDIVLPNSSAVSNTKPSLSITITKDLEYSINDKSVSIEFLESELRKMVEDPNDPIIVMSDKDVPFGKVVEIFDIGYRNKFVNMAMGTEQPK